MSNNAITNPLQSLLSQASKSLPRTTGETDAHRSRHERAGDASVILCDCSGSMDGLAWGGRRKIDLLREAMHDAGGGMAHVYAFADRPTAVPLWSERALPEPGGTTAMHLALDAAATHRPRHTLVISDGQPDDEAAALTAADRLSGTIDVLYIGPDADKSAMDFMRRLARAGGGCVIVNDVTRPTGGQRPSLAHSIRGLLPAPAGGAA